VLLQPIVYPKNECSRHIEAPRSKAPRNLRSIYYFKCAR